MGKRTDRREIETEFGFLEGEDMVLGGILKVGKKQEPTL
jgi:hypothetical protein